MKLLISIIILLSVLVLIQDTIAVPIPAAQQPDFTDYEIEERRRKHKRKKRPCTRNSQEDARWFFGHDVTLFLGDVTICGGNPSPSHSDDANNNDGIYEGVVPVFQRPTHRPHRPHKPHRPHRPHRPNRPNQPDSDSDIKPVQEQIDEDYVQDNYYKPGIIGAINNQVGGQEQNLSNLSPMGILSTISRHFNSIVNPFINLFY